MSENIILPPPPVFFIKSISEQGYTLSTAIADLIDNSITATADRVEILIDSGSPPLKLFIADNGKGMSATELTENMRFPSADLESHRAGKDLGRFGLGMKTASFSQSRKFTVISRKDESRFQGRTWDVEYLKKTKDWTLLVEDEEQSEAVLADYVRISNKFHQHQDNFRVGTLIVWDNLHKLGKLSKKNEINDELDELRSHLGLVFHRFIQNSSLQIRLNNSLVEAFEPFPEKASGVTLVSEQFWKNSETYIRFQGLILPKRSAQESKQGETQWAPANMTLEELQGLFVYRNDRLINFGGWLRSIPKSSYLQFGRIMIDISNVNDSEFQLNVAKSSLKIPFELKRAMTQMIISVAQKAKDEYRERLVGNVIRSADPTGGLALITRVNGADGPVLKINRQFGILGRLQSGLNHEQNDLMASLLVLVENKLNEIWHGDNSHLEINDSPDENIKARIVKIKKYYEESGYSRAEVRNFLLDSFGRNLHTQNFIDSLNDGF